MELVVQFAFGSTLLNLQTKAVSFVIGYNLTHGAARQHRPGRSVPPRYAWTMEKCRKAADIYPNNVAQRNNVGLYVKFKQEEATDESLIPDYLLLLGPRNKNSCTPTPTEAYPM